MVYLRKLLLFLIGNNVIIKLLEQAIIRELNSIMINIFEGDIVSGQGAVTKNWYGRLIRE